MITVEVSPNDDESAVDHHLECAAEDATWLSSMAARPLNGFASVNSVGELVT